MNADIFFTNEATFDRIINVLMGRNIRAERQEFELEEFASIAPEDDIYHEIYGDVPATYLLEA